MSAFPAQPPGPSSDGDSADAPPWPAQRQLRRERRHRPSIRIAALNITSFMDLTFNLLLFFVLTASFSIGEGVLPADLPVGSGSSIAPSTAAPPKNPVLISLRSYGSGDQVAIQIEGSPVTLANFDELYDTLRSWRHDKMENAGGIYEPDNPIIIRPDSGVRWKQVINAFNTVVRAGYTNVGFERPG